MGTMLISRLQHEHRDWVEHNFPHNDPDQAFHGIVEEVGELAHVRLKTRQGIREGLDPITAAELEADAIGDLFIYMMSYANARHLDLEYIILNTWDKVKRRDWQANPQTGEV